MSVARVDKREAKEETLRATTGMGAGTVAAAGLTIVAAETSFVEVLTEGEPAAAFGNFF